MSLDVNSSIEITSTQLFATPLSQSQSLSGNGLLPLKVSFEVVVVDIIVITVKGYFGIYQGLQTENFVQ